MAKHIKIKCRYYQVRAVVNGEVSVNTYDLRPWIDIMNGKLYTERKRILNGVMGRLEEQVQFENEEYYAFNFMRMDEFSSSYKTKDDAAAEHIDIDVIDDEYIAKNTVAFYDPEKSILMIQCNRGGYSESSIQNYINSFFQEQRCCLLPIFENIDVFSDANEYMKLDVRMGNLSEFVPTRNSCFESLIQAFRQLDGLTAHECGYSIPNYIVEIGLGHNRTKRLNGEQVRVALADLNNNRGCVSSAKVKLTDDQITGVYDLFDHIGHDEMECTIDEHGEIGFEYLAQRMYDTYVYAHSGDRMYNIVRGRQE